MVNHLRNKNSSPGTPGPVYAMARPVKIKTKTERSLRKKKKTKENRRARKMKKKTN